MLATVLSASHATEPMVSYTPTETEAALFTVADNNHDNVTWGFHNETKTNKQTVFQRRSEHERVLVAVNADSQPYWAHFDAGCGRAVDLITGAEHDFGGGSELPPYSVFFWKCEA